MNQLHLVPWTEIAVLIPLCGAIVLMFVRDPFEGRKWCTTCSGLAFALEVVAWNDFTWAGEVPAEQRWDLTGWLFEKPYFIIDQLNAPLLPLIALLFFSRRSRRRGRKSGVFRSRGRCCWRRSCWRRSVATIRRP